MHPVPPQSWTAVGAMSGTSMDGLDLACCRFTLAEGRWRFECLAAGTLPFPPYWADLLPRLYHAGAMEYAEAHAGFGRWLGQSMAEFIRRHGLQPDVAAAHGQTIFHQPARGFTAQLGDGEAAAAFLPCPLVMNFRSKDVALGGQGAPLVPLGERELFTEYQLFLNLGGISNLSVQGRGFDLTPCNLALNHWYRQAHPDAPQAYDPDGALAASGRPVPALLAALDALDFYDAPPPKSLGWEWVEQVFNPCVARFAAEIPAADLLHSLCLHIAGQIAAGFRQAGAPPGALLVTGGGRHHRFLLRCLAEALAPMQIRIAEAPALWVDFKEAIIFAFLGLRALLRQPTTLAAVTGAPHDVAGGSVHWPG